MSREAPFEFPADCCCNCGVSDGSVIVEPQNTRLTRHFGLFGIEYSADFHLPFCRQCTITSRRRPPSMFHRLIAAALVSAVVFFGVTLFAISTENEALGERTILISLAAGIVLTTIWYLLRRPRGNQTSFYQPVRIKWLKKDGIALAFTNENYLLRFIARNFELVHSGRVVLRHES